MTTHHPPTCRECGEEMTDVNEGYALLRFGPPAYECHTPDCPRNPDPVVETETDEAVEE